MFRGARRLVIALVAGAYVAGFLGALYLFVANAAEAGRDVGFADFSLATGFFCLPMAGAVIAWHQPGNRTGRLLLVMGLGTVAAVLGSGWATYALRAHPPLPGGEIGAWISCWALVAGLGMAPWFFATFPSGAIESRWLARTSPIAVGALGVGVLSQAFAPGPIDGVEKAFAPIDNPLGVESAARALDIGTALAAVCVVGFLVAAIVDLVIRYRRAEGERRLQMRWMAIATPVLPVTMAVGIALGEGAGDTVLAIGQPIFLVGTAAGVAVAVLKYRLYELDLFLRRSLVFIALTSLVIGGYVAVVALAGFVLADRTGPVPSLIAVGLVAVAFQPARSRLQRAVDRVVYGRRAEPYAVVSALGENIQSALAPDEVLQTIVGTVRDQLRLGAVAIEDTAGRAIAVAGAMPADHAERFPVVDRGGEVATLVVGRRSPNEPLTSPERRLLADLGRQVGAAVHARDLTIALQRSRERLVSSREDDRRRIRRDLHDGLGPTLAGMLLRVDVARDRLAVDPGAAAAELEVLKSQLGAATDEVRRLVHDLRPPALDELGLVEALRAQVASLSQRDGVGLEIDVQAPDTAPPLPAAVEVALLRVCGEALTNVIRHAQARRTTVRLAFGDRAVLEVNDDGIGMNGSGTVGVGLRSMRERASELGGSVDISSVAGGGTTVTMEIPLVDR